MTGGPELHVPSNPVRIVTAASLFDGHDAAINIMRRILQSQGCEVIHLGHNRSVQEVLTAVVQEDAQGVAVSSYQGGHNEYFRYLVDELRARGLGHVRIFGGGGGVIIPSEIAELQAYGVTRIFSPEDGQELGLARMINTIVEACDVDPLAEPLTSVEEVFAGDQGALARAITALELGRLEPALHDQLRAAAGRSSPSLGITGTGGSGKSSLTDELVRRFRLDQEDKLRIAVLAIDPTRRRGGGALLGDRIRMNAIEPPQVLFRSIATRGSSELPEALDDIITACRAAGYDLVIVETPGIGQGDAGIVDHVDLPIYVMTPEFGAASQLEKIDMLDFAEAVVINKFERRGAEDALRDVRRQMARNRERFDVDPADLPVFGTIASRFNDDGASALYLHLRDRLAERGLTVSEGTLPAVEGRVSTKIHSIVPPERSRYLAEIAEAVRGYHATTEAQVAAARTVGNLLGAKDELLDQGRSTTELDAALEQSFEAIDPSSRDLLDTWPQRLQEVTEGTEGGAPLSRETLSGSLVPRVAVPRYDDPGQLLRFLRSEHLPGRFPFTAGVFPLKREGEDPARMFAGEGDAFRTNRRFHLLAEGQPATRLSTAFDSVTLYGFDPDERPDIYGKVGNAGVSIATVDDMKALYDGFELCDPSTSVSMTINGPAPTILAMFLNTAIDQHPELEPAEVLRRVRGTVQADILKEDQGQNTCIFSTEFSLGVMADIQEWFVEHEVRNFYSVSISGYHIAEAGANPLSQLAFTLANGFTYVESYLARGLDIDAFAPNLSFFFSNGMDAEYAVLGRVARRIWAITMRDRYGAAERSQKLKYHVQTSGRSLHAQEMDFNDIRTTLQALIALYDNANSLHTNAYDEAVTTPTAESVRRALAIQLIINREWGLSMNENPNQGSFIIEQLTDLVEEAVLAELERISERGGVLGAMETGYQRGRIQDESMKYEHRKHDGSLPIVGVNTFIAPGHHAGETPPVIELARSTEAEKESQLTRLRAFHAAHADEAPGMLARLRDAALAGDNVFAVLMDAVRVLSLGQITDALFEVGGRYRRNV
jgi:isobutyryl-CoA mutase